MSGGPPGLYAPLLTASVASCALCRHRPGHLLPARTSQSVLGTRPLSRAQLLSGTPNLSMEKMKALLEMTDTLGSAILAFVRVMSRTFPSSRPQRRLWKTHAGLLAARSVTGSRRAHVDPGEPPDPAPGHRGRLALPVLQEAPPPRPRHQCWAGGAGSSSSEAAEPPGRGEPLGPVRGVTARQAAWAPRFSSHRSGGRCGQLCSTPHSRFSETLSSCFWGHLPTLIGKTFVQDSLEPSLFPWAFPSAHAFVLKATSTGNT